MNDAARVAVAHFFQCFTSVQVNRKRPVACLLGPPLIEELARFTDLGFRKCINPLRRHCRINILSVGPRLHKTVESETDETAQ